MTLYKLLEAIINKVNRAVKVDEICNPNLLDNWYFKNPVNQRSETSYTAAGYTIDRWKATGASGVVVNDGYLTFSATTGSAWLMQRLEFPVTGRLTLSALAKSTGTEGGGLSLRTGNADTNLIRKTIPISASYQLVTLTFDVKESTITNDRLYAVFSGTMGTSVDILAVKLELGDAQTLAHQDANGEWVLNEIPKYSEQLAECQRYFQVIPFDSNYIMPVAAGNRYSATAARIPLIFPQDFRIPPTMTIDSTIILNIVNSGAIKTVENSGISIVKSVKNKVVINVTSSDLVSGYPVVLYGQGAQEKGIQCIRFSADL